MRKIIYILFVVIFLTPLGVQTVFSGENLRYKKKLIKSRTERGYTNHGTTIYNYKEIDKYSDNLDDEALGNIKINRQENPRVREVHNWVEMKRDVTSGKKDLSIGEVILEKRQNIREIDNNVSINGDLSVKKPDSLKLGGAAQKNDSNVKEKLNFRDNEISIGSVYMDDRTKANTIQSTIRISGEVNVD